MSITLRRLAILGLLLTVWFTTPCAVKSQSSARLSGVITDKVGAAISRASLRLLSLEAVREAKADEAGKFEFSDLPPGTYDLRISSPGFRAKTFEDLNVGASGLPPLSVTLEIELSPCGDIRPIPSYEKRSDDENLVGFISDFWIGPLKHATVTVALLKTGQTRTATTGEHGKFQFVGLEPGKYALSVDHARYVKQSGIDFWITSQNLTKFTTIYIFRKSEHRKIICE